MDKIRTYQLAGTRTFPQAVDDVDQCLRDALASGDRRVLIDIRQLVGFPKPDIVGRIDMIRRWADTARGRLRMAIVCRAEIIDDERFGVVLAQSLGFDGNVFEYEEEARFWLEQAPGGLEEAGAGQAT
jgi:hypothetical protein